MSNNMLYKVQRGGVTAGDSEVDAAIAKAARQYLNSADYATAAYPMNSQTNPLNANVTEYEQ